MPLSAFLFTRNQSMGCYNVAETHFANSKYLLVFQKDYDIMENRIGDNLFSGVSGYSYETENIIQEAVASAD